MTGKTPKADPPTACTEPPWGFGKVDKRAWLAPVIFYPRTADQLRVLEKRRLLQDLQASLRLGKKK